MDDEIHNRSKVLLKNGEKRNLWADDMKGRFQMM